MVNTKVTIYPNPVGEELKILSKTLPNNILIFDINGKVVLKLKGEYKNIDISKLKKGKYFVHLEYDDGSCTRKFIKE